MKDKITAAALKQSFKEYAKEHLDSTLRLTIEVAKDYKHLDINACIDDFLETISKVALVKTPTNKLFRSFYVLYSEKFRYGRFLTK
jgi:hypothetical protein